MILRRNILKKRCIIISNIYDNLSGAWHNWITSWIYGFKITQKVWGIENKNYHKYMTYDIGIENGIGYDIEKNMEMT